MLNALAMLLNVSALLISLAAIVVNQWVTLVPRLGIRFVYNIPEVKTRLAVLAFGLATLAWFLQPGPPLMVVLVLALMPLSGAVKASRFLPSLNAPRHATAEQAPWHDDAPVLAIEHQGEARAYPLAVLVPHHLIHDEVGGEPVLASW